jgi:hypothetical protein
MTAQGLTARQDENIRSVVASQVIVESAALAQPNVVLKNIRSLPGAQVIA